jgi:hypothetical protein
VSTSLNSSPLYSSFQFLLVSSERPPNYKSDVFVLRPPLQEAGMASSASSASIANLTSHTTSPPRTPHHPPHLTPLISPPNAQQSSPNTSPPLAYSSRHQQPSPYHPTASTSPSPPSTDPSQTLPVPFLQMVLLGISDSAWTPHLELHNRRIRRL